MSTSPNETLPVGIASPGISEFDNLSTVRYRGLPQSAYQQSYSVFSTRILIRVIDHATVSALVLYFH